MNRFAPMREALRPMLTTADLAELLATTPAAILQGRYRGSPMPRATRIGRRLLWDPAIVEKWLDGLLEEIPAARTSSARINGSGTLSGSAPSASISVATTGTDSIKGSIKDPIKDRRRG